MEKIDEIFKSAISFWPDSIDIADGKFIEEISGFRSGNLTKAWDDAEHKSLGDDWSELGVWVIYGLLHQKAKRDFEHKMFNLSPSQLNRDEFKKSLLEALREEGYEQMLADISN
jgi:hypothetical protein